MNDRERATAKIKDSIEATLLVLNELTEACTDYQDAINECDWRKAKEALSTFEEYTEKYWFKLSVRPPLADEDLLSDIFDREMVMANR